MRRSEDRDKLLSRIKQAIGYTPSAGSIDAIWGHFLQLRDVYASEDRFYTSQDKEEAKASLRKLVERAKQRVSKNDTGFGQHYLSAKEEQQAVEFQKIVNGHSFVRSFQEHLADFFQEIEQCLDVLFLLLFGSPSSFSREA